MNHIKYVIVGGGMTGASAARGIRDVDRQGSLAMFSDESHAPYDRPPLSKALWKGEPLESIWRKIGDIGVDLHLGREIATLDPASRIVTDRFGTEYCYGKLLLATGGSPRRLPFADSGVIYFRTLDDYQRVHELARRAAHFAVIGGGFIGSEIAAALAINGVLVTMIFPERSIGARAYPASLSNFLDTYFRGKGVTILAGEVVGAIERAGTKTIIKTISGRSISVDAVVAGIGLQPRIELAQAAGLKVDNGIAVDRFLRTSNPDIYAAGDVASFLNTALNGRMRVEHEDNANNMGRLAGRNMAGQSEPYDHVPFFYSDLFELGYEAVGELDTGLDVIEDWKHRYEKGVIYYLKEGQLRGVPLWNTWNRVAVARALIGGKQQLSASALIGRISD
jgi:3-phenylpropionate/trans-cinnamate dioxygenase ferredoxin reductase component